MLLLLSALIPSIDASIASHGMSKGIGQTDGAQVVIRPSLRLGGLQAGGQWKNVTSAVATGEALLFVGWSGKAEDIDLGFNVARKWLTHVKLPGDDDIWEVSANASRKIGKLGLRVSAIYSPDDFGRTKTSLLIEGGPSYEFGGGFRGSAAIGHRHRAGGADYWAYNAGVSKTVSKGVSAEVRVYDNDRGDLGTVYKRRVVASVKLSF